jgi:hypothetical protein
MENTGNDKMKRIAKYITLGILFAAVMVLVLGLVAWLTQYLWNWLVPDLFSGPVITFWQAAGLLVLSKILLWPIGRGGRWGHRHGGPGPWSARWKSMSPEQRERLKARMREKWCAPRNVAEPSQGTPGQVI